jgi:hypothetical protein
MKVHTPPRIARNHRHGDAEPSHTRLPQKRVDDCHHDQSREERQERNPEDPFA